MGTEWEEGHQASAGLSVYWRDPDIRGNHVEGSNSIVVHEKRSEKCMIP